MVNQIGIDMNKINSHDEPQGAEESVGRRRFVRGVGIAVPIALTVSARSALSATCTTQSAAASIALNNSHNATGDRDQPCQGLSPTAWAARTANQFGTANANFYATFASGPTVKMRAVVKSSDPLVTDLMKYIAAAYVNLQLGLVPANTYTVQNLKGMLAGSYQPVPGVIWDSTAIINYLKTTMNP